MSVTIVILSSGVLAAICSSVISSLLHKLKWFSTRKKSNKHVLNMTLTALYQYNNKFYNLFPLLRELMQCTLLSCLSFKYLVPPECYTEVKCIVCSFFLVVAISAIIQILIYYKFYDEKLVV